MVDTAQDLIAIAKRYEVTHADSRVGRISSAFLVALERIEKLEGRGEEEELESSMFVSLAPTYEWLAALVKATGQCSEDALHVIECREKQMRGMAAPRIRYVEELRAKLREALDVLKDGMILRQRFADRAEQAERERDEAVALLRDLRVAREGFHVKNGVFTVDGDKCDWWERRDAVLSRSKEEASA